MGHAFYKLLTAVENFSPVIRFMAVLLWIVIALYTWSNYETLSERMIWLSNLITTIPVGIVWLICGSATRFKFSHCDALAREAPATPLPLAGSLIGREQDLGWLREKNSDILIVGQPGSGKTFLLRHYSHTKKIFWITGTIEEHVRNALRFWRPTIVIFDDSHQLPQLIDAIKDFRRNEHSNFQLIATCWPGQSDEVKRRLNIPDDSVRTLRLLSRDKIVEILRDLNIMSIWWLRRITDQANGLPGLATTLAYLCHDNQLREVALGDALGEEIRRKLEQLIGKDGFEILASFGIGGARGIHVDVVARFWNTSTHKVLDTLTHCQAAGIVKQIKESEFIVQPEDLRCYFVKKIFFSSSPQLDVSDLIESAPGPDQVTSTLMAAKARGGTINDHFIMTRLENSHDDDLWSRYAAIGPKETAWILGKHPEKLDSIASIGLFHLADEVIPRLLDNATSEGRPSWDIRSPLAILREWIVSAEPGYSDAISRRRKLIDNAVHWIDRGGAIETGVEALCIAMSPAFSRSETDPGLGNKVMIKSDTITHNELDALTSEWGKITSCLKHVRVTNWQHILTLISDYSFPGRFMGRHSDEQRAAFARLSKIMMLDICELSAGHPGVIRTLQRNKGFIDFDLDLPSGDEEFNLLFPTETSLHTGDYEGWFRDCVSKVGPIAERLSQMSTRDAAAKIMEWERWAAEAGLKWPHLTPHLCQMIAGKVASPTAMGREMATVGASPALCAPFLEAAARADEPGWVAFHSELLDNSEYFQLAVLLALTIPACPESVWGEACNRLTDAQAELVKANMDSIPLDRRKRLLRSSVDKIASAAALGLAASEKFNSFDAEIAALWRNAVIRALEIEFHPEEYKINLVFSKSVGLCYEWIRVRLISDRSDIWLEPGNAKLLRAFLSESEAEKLIGLLRDDSFSRTLCDALVNGDVHLYKVLLSNSAAASCHLRVLQGPPSLRWCELAKVAIEENYSPEEVAAALFLHGYPEVVVLAKEEERWREWRDIIEHLKTYPDHRVRRCLEITEETVLERITAAAKRQFQTEVFGCR